MPDDSPESPSPQRSSRPRLSELSRETTEDDLWDLDEDPQESVADSKEAPDKPTPPTPEPEPLPEPASEPASTAADVEAPPEVAASTEPTAPTAESPAHSADQDPHPSPEPMEAEDTAQKRPETRPVLPTRPERKDLINLGVLAAVFLGVAIWWIVSQFSEIPTTRFGSEQPKFPVKGEYGAISMAETYWRAPVREGEQRDIAQVDVEYIPVLSLTISGGTGSLRAVFRTNTGEFVGDSINRSFENGKFIDNGSSTIEFPATDGYESEGDMNGYRIGGDPWEIEILEAPGARADWSSFRSLFIIPVSPIQR